VKLPKPRTDGDPQAAAQAACEDLHEALAVHGICVDLSSLVPDVTVYVEPCVRLGYTTVSGAGRLAQALRDGWTPPDRTPTPAQCFAARHAPLGGTTPTDQATTPYGN